MSQVNLNLSYFQFLLPTALLQSVSILTKIFEVRTASQFVEQPVVLTSDTGNGNMCSSRIVWDTSRSEGSNHEVGGKK